MKAENINPFILAARQVLDMEIHSQVDLGPMTLDSAVLMTKAVKVHLGLTGELEGMVFLGMSEDSACKMTSVMMGEQVTHIDDMVVSCIAELGNVISGRASGIFETSGFMTDISTPTVVVGDEAKISTTNIKPILITLITEVGDLVLMVALRSTRK